MKISSRKLKIVSIITLLFLCFGAIYGGILLIIDPSGKTLGLPGDLIATIPFDSFLIPGLILMVMNGAVSLVISIAVIRNNKYWGYLVTLQGLILFGWLTAELIMGIFDPFMNITFYLVSAVLIVLGVMKQRRELT